MVMGDLVLTGEEVAQVTPKLREAGLEITALHNHLLRNEPFTMYMHVHGHGQPGKLAASLRTALATTICSTTSHGCFSCISGPTTKRTVW